MEPVRVFAAVPLPSEVRLAIAHRLASLEIPGKPIPAENWHLTLRFLGSVDLVTYERFLAGLAEVMSIGRFRVRLASFGAFPRSKNATVVWLGLDRGVAELTHLNDIAEEAAQAAGLAPEDRPFRPHLTIARVRPPVDVRWMEHEDFSSSWVADRVVVYQSHLGGGPARYEPLETFELSG